MTFRQTANKLAVRVGTYHSEETDPDEEDIPVSSLILHENFDSYTIENDICLIKLEYEADITSDAIDTIGLPPAGKEYEAGTECKVSGWGNFGSGGTPSLHSVLQKVSMSELVHSNFFFTTDYTSDCE